MPGGKYLGKSTVVAFRARAKENEDGSLTYHIGREDWALLVLDAPLGDRFGWFDLMSIEDQFTQDSRVPVTMASYPSDKGAEQMYKEECSIRGIDASRALMHDCSSSFGASGAPIFYKDPTKSQYVIVGLHSGAGSGGVVLRQGEHLNVAAYSPMFANRAISAKHILPSLAKLRSEQESILAKRAKK